MTKDIHAVVARTFLAKLRGLMWHQSYEGFFVLSGCRSIHTCWMRFPLDIICLDETNMVVDIRQSIAPWRMVFPHPATRTVIECMTEANMCATFQIGDTINIVEIVSHA